MLYFAYGSNIDQEQMADRCPNARFYKFAVMPDTRLIFTGYSQVRKGSVASLTSAPQKYVEGVLYSVEESDILSLDRYENTPVSYQRGMAKVITDSGEVVEAWVYTKSEQEPSVPHEDYFSKIYKFYARYGFNRAHLEEAKK